MSLGLGLGLGLSRAQSQRRNNDMILVYEIPDPNTPIELAIQANSTYFPDGQGVVIDWGDGSAKETVSDTGGSTYIGHTYASAGTYTIKISGSMTMYGRDAIVDILGQTFLTRIDSFGKLGITSLGAAFYKCTGLVSVPRTLPDSVTYLTRTFQACSGNMFNPNVSNWDVSNVTSMFRIFSECSGAAFRGGRGVSGNGIANWRLRMSGVNMGSFMLNSKTQEPAFLDEILNAWAALHAEGQLPTNTTVSFGNNKYTADGADAYTTLTTITDSGGAGWTILSGGLQS